MLATEENDLLIWGPVFKDSSSTSTEGFKLYSGEHYFDGGIIDKLSVRYSIFGAVVKE